MPVGRSLLVPVEAARSIWWLITLVLLDAGGKQRQHEMDCSCARTWRAGTGSHAGTEGGVPEEMAGANPGPAIAGAALGSPLPGWYRWLCWFRRCWGQLNEWCHPIGLLSMKLFWAHSCLAEADGRGEPIDDLVAVMHVEVGLVLVSAAWYRMGR